MASHQYRPAIDGLRALAVLSVFIFHLDHRWLPGGFVGVDVFFVISGYLITSIILKDCEAGSFSLATFYQRRIARIFPAFFTVALATLAAAAVVYSPQDFASAGANFVATILSAANLKFMLQGDYFAISPDAQPFLHYWSLSVEEQFYLFFPLLLPFLFKHARRHIVAILAILALGSLLACIVMTPIKPVWAFYLLPTRAWELAAGSLLAVASASAVSTRQRWFWLPPLGLLVILLSLVVVREGPTFPGWQAILPVAGTVAVLFPLAASNRTSERWLSNPLLVAIGKVSYSLYLWHWPVFSLVDYQCYLASDFTRLALKVGLSVIATAVSFFLIEGPFRTLLNRRPLRRLTFAAAALVTVVCIPVGMAIRKNNYVNAELADVSKGGLVFPAKPGAPSVLLMGDSNGSMYGKVLKEICSAKGYKLTVISVAAGDPLPGSRGEASPLWDASLACVERERPDVLVLACHWQAKLALDPTRLPLALSKLAPQAGRIVVLNQPPILPPSANRARIRDGERPPFVENEDLRLTRTHANVYLKQLVSPKVSLIDIAGDFELTDGAARFLDDRGRQLYHDSTHLSGYGAERIRPLIEAAIAPVP